MHQRSAEEWDRYLRLKRRWYRTSAWSLYGLIGLGLLFAFLPSEGGWSFVSGIIGSLLFGVCIFAFFNQLVTGVQYQRAAYRAGKRPIRGWSTTSGKKSEQL
jgi:hypothetical protein